MEINQKHDNFASDIDNAIISMKTPEYKSHLILDALMQLGEGALWDPDSESFLFVDILRKKIGQINLVDNQVKFYDTDEYVGTVVNDVQGNLISAQKGKIVQLNPLSGDETILHDIEPDHPSNRSNDGKCDPAGRFWFGTMDMNAQSGKGNLYSFDGRNLVLKISGTSISNGMCWSSDKQTMYYVDSATQFVQAFDYDVFTGNITRGREIILIPEEDGTPDGMTIDSEDKLWIALWGGGCVKRYDPVNGEVLAVVWVDAPQVSSCALGGKNGNQLLITTARDGMSDDELRKYPLSGSLFLAEVDAEKAAIYRFKNNK